MSKSPTKGDLWSKSKKTKEGFKQEDILQAILIADSFNVRFSPVTHSKPRALLPLLNVPLIEYTLECLATSGIEQVILFCSIHADQIKQYIKCSKWSSPTCPMEIMILVSESCTSVGDALRDIDAKSLIATDFVLINGDIISNVNLKPIVEAHKQRRLKEKTPIMTMLCKKAPPDHRTRCSEEDVVMGVENHRDRIIHYQKVHDMSKFEFPVELFTHGSEVSLRFDLLDSQISICSPILPTLFTDNFDYLTKDDFIKGILDNEEILGNTIHLHLLKDEYAARVSNLFMYEAISKNVLNRWSYPLVPDKNISQRADDKYRMRRHNIYLHNDVTLARGCILEENVIIGKNSSVGSNSKIAHSVIGKNVIIGENVDISGAYVWDGCEIDDNCTLHRCLLDTNVHLKSRVHVKSGCVLAKDVVIGPQIVLASATSLVSSLQDDADFGDDENNHGDNNIQAHEDSTNTIDVSLVGTEGVAYRYESPVDSDDEDTQNITHEKWGLSLQKEDVEDSASSISSASDDRDAEAGFSDDADLVDSDAELNDGEKDDDEELSEDEDSQLFYTEVLSTLHRGISDEINEDNLILEINSAKSAYGIYIQEVNLVITKALLKLPFKQKDGDIQSNEYFTLLKKDLEQVLPVVKNYIRSADSQNDCLLSIQDVCTSEETVQKNLVKILKYLYDEDIISEEVILKWYKNEDYSSNESTKRKEKLQMVKKDKQMMQFITWLQEAEEESD